jgi:hypothetical protein
MFYTDPGSSALLWQLIVAGAIGALFYVRKLLSFFRKDGRMEKPECLGSPKLNRK